MVAFINDFCRMRSICFYILALVIMKVVTLVGTRPEVIKLALTIRELDRYVDHVLVHTGQNYDFELNEIFFKELNIRKPDYFLEVADSTPAKTVANVISRFDDVLCKEKPDAVLLYGDTNSCLGAFSAKRRKIPIFHMEAGNRCFDLNVPEEINRGIVDKLADINMVLCEHSRRYLEREGVRPETIIKVGSSMKELLDLHKDEIAQSRILKKLHLEQQKYFVVSAHREESVDVKENLDDLISSLNDLVHEYNYPIIFSTHPRTQKRLTESGYVGINGKIIFSKPFGFFDYINLQKNAFCVLSDSGTITEESSILGFPAVTIRDVHERPEGNDEGTLVMCGYKSDRVLKAVEVVASQYLANKKLIRIVKDYDVDNVAEKVVRIILSYTDYVNDRIWRK